MVPTEGRSDHGLPLYESGPDTVHPDPRAPGQMYKDRGLAFFTNPSYPLMRGVRDIKDSLLLDKSTPPPRRWNTNRRNFAGKAGAAQLLENRWTKDLDRAAELYGTRSCFPYDCEYNSQFFVFPVHYMRAVGKVSFRPVGNETFRIRDGKEHGEEAKRAFRGSLEALERTMAQYSTQAYDSWFPFVILQARTTAEPTPVPLAQQLQVRQKVLELYQESIIRNLQVLDSCDQRNRDIPKVYQSLIPL